MGGSVNELVLVGNLGADPILYPASHPDGRPHCKFMLATHRDTLAGEVTTWHRVTVWGHEAEVCAAQLTKGHQVYVKGRLDYRVFRVGSQRRWAANIEASRVVFMERGDGSGPSAPDMPDDEPE